MLDWQHQRMDIPAHARTAHKGLLQKGLKEKRISAELSLMSSQWPDWSRDWTEQCSFNVVRLLHIIKRLCVILLCALECESSKHLLSSLMIMMVIMVFNVKIHVNYRSCQHALRNLNPKRNLLTQRLQVGWGRTLAAEILSPFAFILTLLLFFFFSLN